MDHVEHDIETGGLGSRDRGVEGGEVRGVEAAPRGLEVVPVEDEAHGVEPLVAYALVLSRGPRAAGRAPDRHDVEAAKGHWLSPGIDKGVLRRRVERCGGFRAPS
jgi:hypothetical protein